MGDYESLRVGLHHIFWVQKPIIFIDKNMVGMIQGKRETRQTLSQFSLHW
jgi:hypothetical protein